MNRLIKTVTIKAGFSWIDWGLYDNPGVVRAGYDLNRWLEEVVNAGYDRSRVENEMHHAFKKFENFGANDSEPHHFLEQVLNDIFGED